MPTTHNVPIDAGPLDAAERVALEAFLDERIEPLGGLSIEYVDGFFAGLITMPGVTPPSVWLPHVLDESEEDKRPRFRSTEEAARILGLLMRHWNHVAHGLRMGGAYTPLTRVSPLAHEGPRGRAWARSFMVAGEMAGGRTWQRFMQDPMGEAVVAPIIRLALEGEMDDKGRTLAFPQEERDKLLELIAGVLPTLGAVLRSVEPDRARSTRQEGSGGAKRAARRRPAGRGH